MWMLPPEIMCNKHLLGEHHEIHMLEGCLLKGKSVEWALYGMVFPMAAPLRHEAIVKEMLRRGMLHSSILRASIFPSYEKMPYFLEDTEHNRAELYMRCVACRELQRKAKDTAEGLKTEV
jgi:hypothetical protein